MKRDSLQLRLSLWLLAAILLVAALAAILSYRSAYDEAIELQDTQLREMAALVARSDWAPAADQAIDTSEAGEDRIVFGRVGSKGHAFPPQLWNLVHGRGAGFHTGTAGGVEWRVFLADAKGGPVAVAQRTAIRDDVAQDGAERALMPFLFVIPVLLAVVAVIVRRMFAPLRALAGKVDARAEDDVGAIDDAGLPREIEPLVKAINRLLARVDQAMTAQRRFVADAAHELRTPLAALTLQAERLDGVGGERLAALHAGLARSRALVEQLLLLARMQQTALDTDAAATRIGPTLRSVMALYLPLADRRGIDLGVEGDAEIDVAVREIDLSTLLRNLIDNAVRYTPNGGRVDVVVAQDAAGVRIEICDTGPGIPAAERERVFEPFYRLAADAEGSGLGLAIVKAIADRYGASVTIDGAPAGSRFVMRLPGQPDRKG